MAGEQQLYSVYHCTDMERFFFGKTDLTLWGGPDRDKHYHIVAMVQASDLEAVYRMTNHIDCDWRENALVRTLSPTPPRSTSVGDVITQGQQAWLVANRGFIPL